MVSATVALASDRKDYGNELQQCLQDSDIAVSRFSVKDSDFPHPLHAAPDMIVLDCCKQDVQELTICGTIRKRYSGPIALISDPVEEQYALLALQLGVDFTLPVTGSPRLIAENIRALLSRLIAIPVSALQYGELRIDAGKREAYVADRSITLSTIEFELLWLLCKKAGQAVSREAIYRELYNIPYNGYDRSIDLYISRIRNKIGDPASSPAYLKTVRGIGYQFVAPPEEVEP